MGGLSGQASDIDIHAKEILRLRKITSKILSDHTGQSLEKVEQDVDRDYIMTAEEACSYGLVDQVIVSHELSKA